MKGGVSTRDGYQLYIHININNFKQTFEYTCTKYCQA